MDLPGTFGSQMFTDLTVEDESLEVPAQSGIGARSISPSDLPGAQRVMEKVKDRIAGEPEQFVESVTQNLFDGLVEQYGRLVEETADRGDEGALEELTLIDPQKLGDHSPGDLLDRIDFETWRAEHPSAPLWETVEESVDPEGDAYRLASWALFYALRDLEQRLLDAGAVVSLTTTGIEKDKKLEEFFEEEGYLETLLQRLSADTAGGILAGLQEGQGGDLSLPYIERLLGLDDPNAPTPRPVTPEFDPTPWKGEPPMSEVLADPFANKAVKALREASGKPSDSHEEEWGRDQTGHPIWVEELRGQYEGEVTFKVQAYGEPNPSAIEASMGWKMLGRMDMDTVWLHLYLLAYASAPHRRGDRSVIEIPRRRVEKVFGFRNRNYTVGERAREIKEHVEALQSVFVQFQNVQTHDDKLKFGGDMIATPLWNLQMRAEGEKNLFTGEIGADWHLQAREGIWAEEFLHEHGDQWTPLPKKWFEQIDRRGEPRAQRLAVYLLLQFRINAKNGYRVKTSVQTLLEVCGFDLNRPRTSKERHDLKAKLSSTLDTLGEDYGIEVHDERAHIDHTKGLEFSAWKNRVVQFDPPLEMDRRLFGESTDDSPPLPEVVGDWKPDQIRHLRTELVGESQSDFGDRFGVTKQYISALENGRRTPSIRVQKELDRLQTRFE